MRIFLLLHTALSTCLTCMYLLNLRCTRSASPTINHQLAILSFPTKTHGPQQPNLYRPTRSSRHPRPKPSIPTAPLLDPNIRFSHPHLQRPCLPPYPPPSIHPLLTARKRRRSTSSAPSTCSPASRIPGRGRKTARNRPRLRTAT